MKDEILTSDLAEFGARERHMAKELLEAWETQGLPEDFYDDEVTIAFNKHSGCVFLTNSDFQAAMLNGDKLETWYNCPYCGHEGFKEDMDHEPQDKDCTRYLVEIGVLELKPDDDLE
jgi:hypothetical protein